MKKKRGGEEHEGESGSKKREWNQHMANQERGIGQKEEESGTKTDGMKTRGMRGKKNGEMLKRRKGGEE